MLKVIRNNKNLKLINHLYSNKFIQKRFISFNNNNFNYNNKQINTKQPFLYYNNNFKKFFTTNSENKNNNSNNNNNNNNINNNKIILKKFFLKVHPDLFYQFPTIKKNNDESLRTLLGFLEEIKSEKISKRTYNIKFYYQDDNVYDNENDIPSVSINFDIDFSSSSASSSSNSFEKIVFTLREAQTQIKSLFKQLGIKEEFILHNMIGGGVGGKNGSNGLVDSLLQFIKQVSPIAREQQISFIEQEREIDLMYTYFYMEHKIRVLFQDHDLPLKQRKEYLRKLEKILNKISPRKETNVNIVQEIFERRQQQQNKQQEQSFYQSYRPNYNNNNNHHEEEKRNKEFDMDINIEMNGNEGFGSKTINQQLFSEFGVFGGKNKENFAGWAHIKSGYITPESNPKSDECNLRDRLEGVSVVFSQHIESGIDLEGRLILNTNDRPSEWTKILKTFKPSEIIQNIQKCKQRQSIEKELSKSLNIASIFTDYSYQNSKEYLDLLNNLHEQFSSLLLENNGFLPIDHNEKLNGLDEINIKIIKEEDTDKIEPWKFNSKLVAIQVPLNTTFDQIYTFLKSNNHQIKKEIERHKINSRNLAQLELTVRRQFRLKSLKKIDESIGMNEMVTCLKRLLTNNQPFLPYLYGMKVIIGNENKINNDGSIIINWCFEL